MLPEPDFEHLPRFALSNGFRHVECMRLESTNQSLLHVAEKAENDRLWLTAHEQTQGRGRSGRQWVSQSGNLFASVLLLECAPPDKLPTLSLVSSLALYDAVEQYAPDRQVRLKWPNDVLVDGQKIAGLLLEAQHYPNKKTAVVAGFGVNCKFCPPKNEEMLFPPICFEKLGVRVAANEIFTALHKAFALRLDQWRAGEGLASIIDDWRARAHGLGEQIRARTGDETYYGIFENINEDGCLLLRTPQKVIKISAADVFFG